MKHIFAEIESGKFKGKRMILTVEQAKKRAIPKVVMVEDGVFMGTPIPKFSPHCLVHEIKVPDQGCPKCKNG